MARVPINSETEQVRSLFTEKEVKMMQPRGLFIDTEFLTLWTKTAEGEMVSLGGGQAIDISGYPGLGEVLKTELPLKPNTIAGNPLIAVEVLNHLYARATSKFVPVRNPVVSISNPVVDKEAETITFDATFVDFLTLYEANVYLTTADGDTQEPLFLENVVKVPEQDVSPAVRTFTVPLREFSLVRNRLMVVAVNSEEEELESNRLLLDLEPLPLVDGSFRLDSYSIELRVLTLKVQQINVDFNKPITVFTNGILGQRKLIPTSALTHPQDTTVEWRFSFDELDGLGTITFQVEGTDLNGKAAGSNGLEYTFSNDNLKVDSLVHSTEDLTFSATVSHEILDTPQSVVASVVYPDTSERGAGTVYSGGGTATLEGDNAVANGLWRATRITAAGRSAIVREVLAPEGRIAPTLTITGYDYESSDEFVYTEARVEFMDDGIVIGPRIMVSDTELGEYTQINGYLSNVEVDVSHVDFRIALEPQQAERWVKVVMVYEDHEQEGPARKVMLDSHGLRITELDLKSSTYYPKESHKSLHTVPFEIQAKDYDSDTWKVVGSSTDGGKADIIAASLAELGPALDTRLVYDFESLRYYTNAIRFIKENAGIPDPTAVLTRQYINPVTGITTLEGTISTLARPFFGLIGNSQIPLKWSGNTFTIELPGNSDTTPTRERFVVTLGRHYEAGISVVNNLEGLTPGYGTIAALKVETNVIAGTIDLYYKRGGFVGRAQLAYKGSDGVEHSLHPDANYFEIAELPLGELEFIHYLKTENGTTVRVAATGRNNPVTMATIPGNTSLLVDVNPYTALTTVTTTLTVGEPTRTYNDYWLIYSAEGALLYREVPDFSNHTSRGRTVVLDALKGLEGEYIVKFRSAYTKGLPYEESITVQVRGPYMRVVNIGDMFNSESSFIPSLDESENPDAITFTQIQIHSDEGGNKDRNILLHPDYYAANPQAKGVNLDEYNGTIARATIADGPSVRFKVDNKADVYGPRILDVKQSGDIVEVQWRLRTLYAESLMSQYTTLVEINRPGMVKIEVVPMEETPYDLINTVKFLLPPEVQGPLDLSITLRKMVNGTPKDVPAAKTRYYPTNRSYLSVLEQEFSAITFLGNEVVNKGPNSPRATLYRADFDNPEVIYDDVPFELDNDTGVWDFSSMSGDRGVLSIRVTYESTLDGKRYELVAPFNGDANINQKFIVGEEYTAITNERVDVKAFIEYGNNDGLFNLQSKDLAKGETSWHNRIFKASEDSLHELERGVRLSFERRVPLDGTEDTRWTLNRITAGISDGYSAAYRSNTVEFNTDSGLIIVSSRIKVYEHDPADVLYDIYSRGVDPAGKVTYIDDNGVIVDCSSTFSLRPVLGYQEEPTTIESVHLGRTLPTDGVASSYTIHMEGLDGMPMSATWPKGADEIPLPGPAPLEISHVKYVTAEDGESVSVVVEFNGYTVDLDTLSMSVDYEGITPLENTAELVSEDTYRLSQTVADNNISVLSLAAKNLAGASVTSSYVFTGNEITEGSWGVPVAPPKVVLPCEIVSYFMDEIRQQTTLTFMTDFTAAKAADSKLPRLGAKLFIDDVESDAYFEGYYSGNEAERTVVVPTVLPGTVFRIEWASTDELELRTYGSELTFTGDEPKAREYAPINISNFFLTEDADGVTNRRIHFVINDKGRSGEIYYTFNRIASSLRRVDTYEGYELMSEGRRKIVIDIPDDITEVNTLEVIASSETSNHHYQRIDLDGTEEKLVTPDYTGRVLTGLPVIEEEKLSYRYDYNEAVHTAEVVFPHTGLDESSITFLADGQPARVISVNTSSSYTRFTIEVPHTDLRFIQAQGYRTIYPNTLEGVTAILSGIEKRVVPPVEFTLAPVTLRGNPYSGEVLALMTLVDVPENVNLRFFTPSTVNDIDITLTPTDVPGTYTASHKFDTLEDFGYLTVYDPYSTPPCSAVYRPTGDEKVEPLLEQEHPITNVEFVTFNTGLTEMYVTFDSIDAITGTIFIEVDGVTEPLVLKGAPRTVPAGIEVCVEVSGTDITGFELTILDNQYQPYRTPYVVTGNETITDGSVIPEPEVPTEKSMGDFKISSVVITEDLGVGVTFEVDADLSDARWVTVRTGSDHLDDSGMRGPYSKNIDGKWVIEAVLDSAVFDVLSVDIYFNDSKPKSSVWLQNEATVIPLGIGVVDATSEGTLNPVDVYSRYSTLPLALLEFDDKFAEVDWATTEVQFEGALAEPVLTHMSFGGRSANVYLDLTNYVPGTVITLTALEENGEVFRTSQITLNKKVVRSYGNFDILSTVLDKDFGTTTMIAVSTFGKQGDWDSYHTDGMDWPDRLDSAPTPNMDGTFTVTQEVGEGEFTFLALNFSARSSSNYFYSAVYFLGDVPVLPAPYGAVKVIINDMLDSVEAGTLWNGTEQVLTFNPPSQAITKPSVIEVSIGDSPFAVGGEIDVYGDLTYAVNVPLTGYKAGDDIKVRVSKGEEVESYTVSIVEHIRYEPVTDPVGPPVKDIPYSEGDFEILNVRLTPGEEFGLRLYMEIKAEPGTVDPESLRYRLPGDMQDDSQEGYPKLLMNGNAEIKFFQPDGAVLEEFILDGRDGSGETAKSAHWYPTGGVGEPTGVRHSAGQFLISDLSVASTGEGTVLTCTIDEYDPSLEYRLMYGEGFEPENTTIRADNITESNGKWNISVNVSQAAVTSTVFNIMQSEEGFKLKGISTWHVNGLPDIPVQLGMIDHTSTGDKFILRASTYLEGETLGLSLTLDSTLVSLEGIAISFSDGTVINVGATFGDSDLEVTITDILDDCTVVITANEAGALGTLTETIVLEAMPELIPEGPVNLNSAGQFLISDFSLTDGGPVANFTATIDKYDATKGLELAYNGTEQYSSPIPKSAITESNGKWVINTTVDVRLIGLEKYEMYVLDGDGPPIGISFWFTEGVPDIPVQLGFITHTSTGDKFVNTVSVDYREGGIHAFFQFDTSVVSSEGLTVRYSDGSELAKRPVIQQGFGILDLSDIPSDITLVFTANEAGALGTLTETIVLEAMPSSGGTPPPKDAPYSEGDFSITEVRLLPGEEFGQQLVMIVDTINTDIDANSLLYKTPDMFEGHSPNIIPVEMSNGTGVGFFVPDGVKLGEFELSGKDVGGEINMTAKWYPTGGVAVPPTGPDVPYSEGDFGVEYVSVNRGYEGGYEVEATLVGAIIDPATVILNIPGSMLPIEPEGAVVTLPNGDLRCMFLLDARPEDGGLGFSARDPNNEYTVVATWYAKGGDPSTLPPAGDFVIDSVAISPGMAGVVRFTMYDLPFLGEQVYISPQGTLGRTRVRDLDYVIGRTVVGTVTLEGPLGDSFVVSHQGEVGPSLSASYTVRGDEPPAEIEDLTPTGPDFNKVIFEDSGTTSYRLYLNLPQARARHIKSNQIDIKFDDGILKDIDSWSLKEVDGGVQIFTDIDKINFELITVEYYTTDDVFHTVTHSMNTTEVYRDTEKVEYPFPAANYRNFNTTAVKGGDTSYLPKAFMYRMEKHGEVTASFKFDNTFILRDIDELPTYVVTVDDVEIPIEIVRGTYRSNTETISFPVEQEIGKIVLRNYHPITSEVQTAFAYLADSARQYEPELYSGTISDYNDDGDYRLKLTISSNPNDPIDTGTFTSDDGLVTETPWWDVKDNTFSFTVKLPDLANTAGGTITYTTEGGVTRTIPVSYRDDVRFNTGTTKPMFEGDFAVIIPFRKFTDNITVRVLPKDGYAGGYSVYLNGSTTASAATVGELDTYGGVNITIPSEGEYFSNVRVVQTDAPSLESTVSTEGGTPGAGVGDFTVRGYISHKIQYGRYEELVSEVIVEGDDLDPASIVMLSEIEAVPLTVANPAELIADNRYRVTRDYDGVAEPKAIFVRATTNAGVTSTVKLELTSATDTTEAIRVELDDYEYRGFDHRYEIRFYLTNDGPADKVGLKILHYRRGGERASLDAEGPWLTPEGKIGCETYSAASGVLPEQVIVYRSKATGVIYNAVRNDDGTEVKVDSAGNPYVDKVDGETGISRGPFKIGGVRDIWLNGVATMQFRVITTDKVNSVYVQSGMVNGELVSLDPPAEKVKESPTVWLFNQPRPNGPIPIFYVQTKGAYISYLNEYRYNQDAPTLPDYNTVTVTKDNGQYVIEVDLNEYLTELTNTPVIAINGRDVALANEPTGVDKAVILTSVPIDYIDFDKLSVKYLNGKGESVEIPKVMDDTVIWLDGAGDPIVMTEVSESLGTAAAWGDGSANQIAHFELPETSLDNIEDVNEIMYRYQDSTAWTIFEGGAVMEDGKVMLVSPFTFTWGKDVFIRYNRINNVRVTISKYITKSRVDQYNSEGVS